jgi:thioredoxin reductase (NADPH)
MESTTYDVIIVGGGPAGLTAGIYARRSKLETLLIEKMAPGGQVLSTHWVDNYPGFPEGLAGYELSDRMRQQAERFGLSIASDEITGASLEGPEKVIHGVDRHYRARAVIVASGAVWKKLGVPGEERLAGRGVSYCATCDGPFYQDLEVAVVGGGDSAVQEAVYLTRFVKKVYLIHRRDQLRACRILQERALTHPKIEPLWKRVVESVEGGDQVEALKIKTVDGSAREVLPVQGVFIYVGIQPNTDWLPGTVQLDAQGFIPTDDRMATSVPGVFAAGDVRSKMVRQISTAVGDAATALLAAEHYLENL